MALLKAFLIGLLTLSAFGQYAVNLTGGITGTSTISGVTSYADDYRADLVM
jgi:hypothetical protein